MINPAWGHALASWCSPTSACQLIDWNRVLSRDAFGVEARCRYKIDEVCWVEAYSTLVRSLTPALQEALQ